MALLHDTTILVLALCAFFFTTVESQNPVDNICLGCLCEAASNCDRNLQCLGDVCGLFKITHAYWVDAGKPVLTDDDPTKYEAYQRCVTNPFCAGNTVQGYMTKYAKDCNGDGAITCYDYAALHHLGGYGCSGEMNREFKSRLENCLLSVSSLNG